MQGAILTATATSEDVQRLGTLGAFDAAVAQLREQFSEQHEGGPFSLVVEAEN